MPSKFVFRSQYVSQHFIYLNIHLTQYFPLLTSTITVLKNKFGANYHWQSNLSSISFVHNIRFSIMCNRCDVIIFMMVFLPRHYIGSNKRHYNNAHMCDIQIHCHTFLMSRRAKIISFIHMEVAYIC